MKHLIETENPSGLAITEYDRLILNSATNDVIVKGGGYVDLGLPSGLKWAKCNVGAKTETDYGYYFQWGDIVDKSNADCSWESYKYGNGGSNLTKYNQSDGKTVLESTDDAASQIMGGDWRMPTKTEFKELIDNTTNQWVTNYNGSGVNGRKFTGSNGNSIFIPAAGNCGNGSVNNVGDNGYVWSSSLLTSSPDYAWYLGFRSDNCRMGNGTSRCVGLSVRGVRK